MVKKAIIDFFKKLDYLLTFGITIVYGAFIGFFSWTHKPEDTMIVSYKTLYILLGIGYLAFLVLYSVLSIYYKTKQLSKENVEVDLEQKIRKIIDNPTNNEIMLIANKSPFFKINMLVSIYYDEGKSDSCERFICLGKIKNINDRGYPFITIVDKSIKIDNNIEEYLKNNSSKLKIKITIVEE